ncbi:MAG: hypothetical protein CBD77_03395 [bacterium TMED217]|nr:MAG: hypothetical protein CBD77_03395 [bacterium TMED217]
MQYSILRTELGRFGIITNKSNIIRIILPNQIKFTSSTLTPSNNYTPFMKNVIKQMNQYFCGNRKNFNIRLKIQLPPFYQKVLKEVSKIPYGETSSYKNIAENLQNPKAYRAVANANAINPIPIIIPCHRVILSNGHLGKYGGGKIIKKKLIQKELNNNSKF